jgi:hypothetical protein
MLFATRAVASTLRILGLHRMQPAATSLHARKCKEIPDFLCNFPGMSPLSTCGSLSAISLDPVLDDCPSYVFAFPEPS